jgi:hypothetical protein
MSIPCRSWELDVVEVGLLHLGTRLSNLNPNWVGWRGIPTHPIGFDLILDP